MATTVEIRQAEASVKMLETLVAVKRAPQTELDAARARLALMREQPAPEDNNQYFERIALERRAAERREQAAPLSKSRTMTELEFKVEILNQLPQPPSDVRALMAAVLAEQDDLKRQEAELSNRLHLVPPGEPCPELVGQILDLRRRIEQKWTEYRFMEKNGRPPEAPADVPRPERSAELLQAERTRQRLADERSKLRKKLSNPAKSVAKELEWSQRLAVVQLELDGLDLTIKTLRA